ncbi:MAG: hypothetical protein IKZ08_05965 [Bacteroidales bacterium]|nr:hypothetical protein [Bacteroidales bacterium]
MKPYKIEIYVYADSEEQAAQVQAAARDFVRKKYEKGILVTAEKLASALRRFEDNILVNQFFK